MEDRSKRKKLKEAAATEDTTVTNVAEKWILST